MCHSRVRPPVMKTTHGPSPAPTNTCSVPGGQCTKSHARSVRSSPSISSRHSPARTRKSSRFDSAWYIPLGLAEELSALRPSRPAERLDPDLDPATALPAAPYARDAAVHEQHRVGPGAAMEDPLLLRALRLHGDQMAPWMAGDRVDVVVREQAEPTRSRVGELRARQ